MLPYTVQKITVIFLMIVITFTYYIGRRNTIRIVIIVLRLFLDFFLMFNQRQLNEVNQKA